MAKRNGSQMKKDFSHIFHILDRGWKGSERQGHTLLKELMSEQFLVAPGPDKWGRSFPRKDFRNQLPVGEALIPSETRGGALD